MPDKNYNLSDLEIAFQKIRDGVSLEGKKTTKAKQTKATGVAKKTTGKEVKKMVTKKTTVKKVAKKVAA